MQFAKRKAVNSLRSFTMFTKSDYDMNWHHELLCSYLDRFVSGEIKNLMVFMPPQHGKSELVSRRLPAYLLGRNPKLKIIGASYSPILSQSFNRDVQRVIDTEEYSYLFPDTFLNSTNVRNDAKGSYLRNVDIFETIGHKGFYKSVGVGGALTGTTVDVAIIDDPVKDAVEAQSYVYRNRTWEWYTDVLKTRLHNDSQILLTQTRWHEDDLSGRLLEKLKNVSEEWTILTLPSIKENEDNPEDPREIGEALWGRRHSLKRLLEIKQISIRTFQSLYQQNPQPTQAGGEFYYNFVIEKHTREMAWDMSKPLHLTFDFNVLPYVTLCIWQIDGNNAYQIDEICGTPPNNKTNAVCRLFSKKYDLANVSGLFIYGDPAGKHKDTRSEQGYNDFDLIYNALKVYNPRKRVATSAPPLAVRGGWINQTFGGHNELSITIGENCINTINDYLYVKENADGGKLKTTERNSTGATYEKLGHTSDANDYFLCEAFKREFNKYKRGDKKMNIDFQSLGNHNQF